MENKNENMTGKVSDQQLEDVTGGIYDISDHLNKLSIKIEITPATFYSSEKTPKYAVNQEVKIKARTDTIIYLPCKVVGVSETATGGFIFKEFVYSIEILPNDYDKNNNLEGKVLNDIYESCLFEC